MFIIAQFPVADLRSLAPGAMGRLDTPDWSADDPGEKFIRGFGDISLRNSGGMRGLLGERAFVDFNRAARFCGPICYKQSDWSKPIFIKPWFRRFYFDGNVSGRFEFGFLIPDIAESKVFGPSVRDGYDIRSLALTIAGTPLLVRGVDLPPVSLTLENAGDALGRAYVAATTRRDALTQFPIAETWGVQVAVGSPMIFVRVSEDRPVLVSRYYRRIPMDDDGDIYITTCKTAKRQIQTVAQKSVWGALDEIAPERATRVLFSHLNALVYAASHLATLDASSSHGMNRTQLANLTLRMLKRLETFRPTGPDDAGDEEFAQSLKTFGQSYVGRLDDLVLKLESFAKEMQNPTAIKKVVNSVAGLLELITFKAIEAGVTAIVKSGG